MCKIHWITSSGTSFVADPIPKVHAGNIAKNATHVSKRDKTIHHTQDIDKINLINVTLMS